MGALRPGGRDTLVNALISPAGPEHERVAPAPCGEPVLLPWEALIPNLAALGIASIKLFPMRGERGHDAYSALVARLGRTNAPCAVEPSGGIAPTHVAWLCREGSAAGVTIVPHSYGALRAPDGAIDRRAGPEAALAGA